jgi:GTP-binding protein
MYKIPRVAIVGRANVGKSTLFNKLAGGKFAIVKDEPGITRDTKELACKLSGLNFILIDTAGLENIPKGSLPKFVRGIQDKKQSNFESQMYEQMIEQSIKAIETADLCFFMIDGRVGVSDDDFHFCRIAKRLCGNVKLLINKTESDKRLNITDAELYKLGLGKPCYIAAEHSLGFGDIYEAIKQASLAINEGKTEEEIAAEICELEAEGIAQQSLSEVEEARSADKDDFHRLHIAIIGRPNAGKSTLINTMLGYNRLITGDKAGITRDAISVKIAHRNYDIKLTDTAGLRKALRIQGGGRVSGEEVTEKLSAEETLRTLRLCNIAVLLIDVTEPFVVQDLVLASKVCKEGRNLIIAMNKIDKLTEEQLDEVKYKLTHAIGDLVPNLHNPSIILTSGKQGLGTRRIIPESIRLYENWNKRVKTSVLNEWLKAAESIQRPKMINGRQTRLKYITQIKTRPPTFKLYVNLTEGINDSYLRFLSKRIAKDFGIEGVPIRIDLVKTKNKYVAS